jgi:hypothetical protein
MSIKNFIGRKLVELKHRIVKELEDRSTIQIKGVHTKLVVDNVKEQEGLQQFVDLVGIACRNNLSEYHITVDSLIHKGESENKDLGSWELVIKKKDKEEENKSEPEQPEYKAL